MKKLLALLALLFVCSEGCLALYPTLNLDRTFHPGGEDWAIGGSVFRFHASGLAGEADFMSAELYRRINGKWSYWATLDPTAFADECEKCDLNWDWRDVHYWEERDYLFIVAGNDDDDAATVFRVSTRLRCVVDHEEIAVYPKGFRPRQEGLTDGLPRPAFVPAGRSVVLLFPVEGAGIRVVRTNWGPMRDFQCYNLEDVRIKKQTNLEGEWAGENLKIRWADAPGQSREQNFPLAQLKTAPCR